MALSEVITAQLDNISSDAATSRTLPGAYYYDPDIFEAEKEAIFYRTWQYVGHVSMLPEPGSYRVRDIADESIIILRDKAGALRAFYNVCQHRAHRLLEGDGSLKAVITCPYHSWSYGLGGELRTARGVEQLPDFDKSVFCLKPVRIDTLCGFIFVNMDSNATSLADSMPGLEAEIRSFSPEPEKLKLAYQRDYNMQANWKNSVENFSECVHCPNQHKSFAETALDIRSYRIDVHPGHHSHSSRKQQDMQAYQVDSTVAGRPDEFGGWLIWPNLSLEVYPGGNLNIFHHIPVGPEETRQAVEWYFPETELAPEEQEVVDFVHIVREEDLPICESVQKGLHSRGYGQGRFIMHPERTDLCEHAVHDFQLKVLNALDHDRS